MMKQQLIISSVVVGLGIIGIIGASKQNNPVEQSYLPGVAEESRQLILPEQGDMQGTSVISTEELIVHTGVYVNGREITTSELATLNQYVGSVPQGAYWLDEQGNYGIEGNSQVLGNLYAGGSATTGGGGGQDGDNFWSSGNFGAGNYNNDNTQGYVSVPGYGPVDYGM